MKVKVVFFAALALISCNTRFERYPVQGKWKIEQLIYQRDGLPDSIINLDLGYILFQECENDSNDKGQCKAVRVYPDGTQESFNFNTHKGTHENERTRVINLGYNSESTKLRKELLGHYRIEKLTDQELVLVCTNCVVGTSADGVLNKFELRATKVPE